MIKKLVTGDHHVWRALALEAIAQQPECFVTTIDEERAIPLSWFAEKISEQHVFVAGNDEGLAVLRIDGEVGYITSVYVRGSARRRGFADALLAVIRVTADTEHCERVVLQVFKDNIAAVSLYEKHGFKLTQAVPFGRRTDCTLELVLKAA